MVSFYPLSCNFLFYILFHFNRFNLSTGGCKSVNNIENVTVITDDQTLIENWILHDVYEKYQKKMLASIELSE